MKKKLNKEQFIERSNIIHKNFYDYSEINYINTTKKVIIICPIHGKFEQGPKEHMCGQGCPKCGVINRSNKRKTPINFFLEKAFKTHGDKYDYSLVNYINNRTKVKIICPEHGVFEQTPYCHLNGQGCPKCGNIKISKLKFKTTKYFIEKSVLIHGEQYDYSLVNYIDNNTKVKIICPEHGVFEQTPSNHLAKHGCPECSNVKKLTFNTFYLKSHKTHGDKYDYSLVNYINNRTKVKIICPEHGVFEQTPDCHLRGQGCPICCESKLEREVRLFLTNNNIEFIPQYSKDWLGRLTLDFFLPSYKIGIECQGIQHFIPNDFFGGIESFNDTKKRDDLKNKKCEKKGVKLFYYSKLSYDDYKYYVYNDLNILLKNIKNENI